MVAMLYVIDTMFTTLFTAARKGTDDILGCCHVIAVPDKRLSGLLVTWEDRAKDIVEWFQDSMPKPTMIMVLGHIPIFDDTMLPRMEKLNNDVRVPKAEVDLARRLRGQRVTIAVAGFHKEKSSEIWKLLEEPNQLAAAGTFALLQSAVQEGGGPRGRVSALKHEVMRPFASIRLRMELEREKGNQPIDLNATQNISTAMAEARIKLELLESIPDTTEEFKAAVRKAHAICKEDLYQVATDPEVFTAWINNLNTALDSVRQKAL
jgi:hypothetical protein